MNQVEAIKSAVTAVLESQTSQTTYPYLLIPKVLIAIDEAAAANPVSTHATAAMTANSAVVKVKGGDKGTSLAVEVEPEKPKLSKEERIARMRAGKAAKDAKKKAASASQPAAPVDTKAETSAEVKDAAEALSE